MHNIAITTPGFFVFGWRLITVSKITIYDTLQELSLHAVKPRFTVCHYCVKSCDIIMLTLS